ncbi:hypothetical protein [Leyella stercorea]|uniref:HU family DNA-binding protein n=1 Tax=Leyella stercorea TaxID=363265 RepID=UPI00242B8F97|nr:hypothetical protein [Leyella stercorea]
MSIKYEIHGIKNAKGEGKEQKYVHLFAHEPQSDHALEDDIQANCSLTKADVRAAFSALRDHMVRALASGSRFHLPGVGYFSLSVGLDAPDDKMRADYIRLRNIRFRPERSLLSEVGSGVSFERAAFSSRSRQYTEEQLLSLLRHYFATHTCLTRRDLQRVAGLRESAAKKWLQHLTATGVLQKDGANNAPVYMWRG